MYRRVVNAVKISENDNADSEFCERRRKFSVNEGNNVFFVGSSTPDKLRQDTCCPESYKLLRLMIVLLLIFLLP